jgi:voltage-gated potassium channel
MKHALKQRLKRFRSELITCSVIALMLASPIDDRSPRLGAFVALVQFLLLILGASYIADRRIVVRVALPIGGIWLITRFLEAFGNPSDAYAHLSPTAGLALSCAVLWALLSRFGSISNVTSSIISEAILTYLVIAIAFAQLYWVLDHLMGHVFDKPVPFAQFSTFLYFSMITLSGLGYSNLFPVNPSIRLIAAFENMTGVFYIAIVVSRLVSSYRKREERREERTAREIDQLVSAAGLSHESTSRDLKSS